MLSLDTLFDPDAVESRLRATYGSVPDADADALPADLREAYEERAAIMEYDGGLNRETAEAKALADVARLMEKIDGGIAC